MKWIDRFMEAFSEAEECKFMLESSLNVKNLSAEKLSH